MAPWLYFTGTPRRKISMCTCFSIILNTRMHLLCREVVHEKLPHNSQIDVRSSYTRWGAIVKLRTFTWWIDNNIFLTPKLKYSFKKITYDPKGRRPFTILTDSGHFTPAWNAMKDFDSHFLHISKAIEIKLKAIICRSNYHVSAQNGFICSHLPKINRKSHMKWNEKRYLFYGHKI